MKNIIIITEDYIFLKLLEPIIKNKIINSHIIHCNSFEETKLKVENNNCQLIILDGVMFGVASFEIINYLRVEQKILVPIFFISEVNSEYFRKKALEIGANVYFNKPFNPYEVLEAIVKIFN